MEHKSSKLVASIFRLSFDPYFPDNARWCIFFFFFLIEYKYRDGYQIFRGFQSSFFLRRLWDRSEYFSFSGRNEEEARVRRRETRCILSANGNYINRNGTKGVVMVTMNWISGPSLCDPKIRIPSFNRECKFRVCMPRGISNISSVLKDEMFRDRTIEK